MSEQPDIIYTKVDEAPELASGSFLTIIQSFAQSAGINIGTKDISLAGRIIAQFPDNLPEDKRQPDDLAALGELVMKPEANIIKLPNISASLPQIQACVAELQSLTIRKTRKTTQKRRLKTNTTRLKEARSTPY